MASDARSIGACHASLIDWFVRTSRSPTHTALF